MIFAPTQFQLSHIFYFFHTIDKIRNRAEGQFYPPQFMYNNDSLVTDNHIAIWVIEKVYTQSLFR